MVGNQKARTRKPRATSEQMITVSITLLEDNPIARTGAIATAMMITAIRTNHAQPYEVRGRKVFMS
jgi:hypothetical protein